MCKKEPLPPPPPPKPTDSDGDGVYDDQDQCPDTPNGVAVDAVGCPLDTDRDGVYDYMDKCPRTPTGASVDARGCWVLKGVYFDTDKSNIEPQYYPILDEVVTVLERNPSLKLEIQGHTDNRGSAKYNEDLSEARAKAVMNYLIDQGIERDRLSAEGYGLTKPAYPNTSPENRAKNRRVELEPVG
jgi:OOP family OmpA-OmpF porin